MMIYVVEGGENFMIDMLCLYVFFEQVLISFWDCYWVIFVLLDFICYYSQVGWIVSWFYELMGLLIVDVMLVLGIYVEMLCW